MKRQKTKKAYERYLNKLYAEIYPGPENTWQQFCYLTNKDRGKAVSEKKLMEYGATGKIGTLVRRLDTIAFNTGFNDWNG